MWWAESGRRSLLVVLRGDALDAGWPAATGADPQAWQTLTVPVAQAAGADVESTASATSAASAALPALPALSALPALPALPAAVAAAFADLRARLQQAAASGPSPRPALTVILSGPAVGVAVLPWSEAWLEPARAQAHARAELQARGCDAQPADQVTVDPRPPLGRPRAVFWLPAWLAAEVSALAAALGARSCSVQALQLVAADWAVRHVAAGGVSGASSASGASSTVNAVLGAGVLQLLSGPRPGALGEALADASAAAPLPARVEALWQRARVRFPSLALAPGLRVLSLDEPPPTAPQAGSQVSWLPWPEGAASRAALDRQLLQQARRQPRVEAGPVARRHVRLAWSAAAVASLALAAGLAMAAWQREATAQVLAEQARRPATPVRVAPRSAAELAELRAVNAAVRQINLPLPALLRALEPPRDLPVMLTGLELAARGGDGAAGAEEGGAVKLSAEAPGGRDMTRYVAFLASRRGVGAAQLVRHELDPSRPDGPVRFEVELTWQR